MLQPTHAIPPMKEYAMRFRGFRDRFRPDVLAAIALVAMVIAIFAITVTFDFVDYDDHQVVLKNPFVSGGVTWRGLRWAWGFEQGVGAAFWYNWPLTWMTHQADCQAYGLWPGGHHLTNVMLHACGTVAFFAFLRCLPFSCLTSFILAAIYAIHPAQIESVAWITSRKNVLSALFFFSALLAYIRAHTAAEAPRGITATLAWNALAIAAMLSKATAVVLPLVMLLVDWWPLDRRDLLKSPWRLIGEKSVVLAFAVATVVIGYRAQDTAGAIHEGVSVPDRLAHAAQAVNAYLWMFVSPLDLSPLYLRPPQGFSLGATLACGVLGGSLTLAALKSAHRRPAIAFGWLWFLTTIGPTIGLVPFGGQAWSCRHLQIPMAGLLIAAGAMCVTAERIAAPSARRLGWVTAAVIILSTAVLTVRQLPIWRDAPALAQAMLEHNPADASQWNNFAIVLDKHSAAAPAVIDEVFRRAASLPDSTQRQATIALDHGLFLLKQHEDERACAAFRKCLQMADGADPMQSRIAATATTSLAIGLTRLHKAAEAAVLLRSLHDRVPATATSLNALGNALAACENQTEAVAAFEQALFLEPDDVHLLCNAAMAAARAGDRPTARRHLDRARATDPQNPAVIAAADVLEQTP